MNVSATVKRVSYLLSASLLPIVLSACASRQTTARLAEDAGKMAAVTQAADAAPEETQHSDIASVTLMEPKAGGLGIELVKGDLFNQLVIKSPKAADNYKVSSLQSPSRLVLDMLNHPGFDTRVIEANSSFVSKIRFGAHSDKSRIVLDLPGKDKEIQHHVEALDEALVVTLAKTGTSLAMLPLKGQSVLSAPPVDSLDGTQQVSIAKPQIKGLSIESMGADSNMLVADLNGAPTFKMKKTAPSEYVLTLPGTGIEANALQALIAPADNGMIRSVRPMTRDGETQLRIFAAPEATMEARIEGNRLLVSAAAPGAEMKAQPKTDVPAELPPAVKETTIASPSGDAKVEVSNATPADDFSSLLADQPKYSGRLISLDLQDTDIDNALRIIAEVSNLNIIASEDVTGKVTLRLIDVPWDQALDVILKTNGLDKVQEGNVVRIAPVEKLRQERESLKQAQQAEEELEPLTVRYLRVSYAKAAELKTLVDSVLSERGSAAYDERTNQIIVKDIAKGARNVSELVKKLDLRTPQVLLETQIVEGSRRIVRDLGSEFGFNFIQSPATGNATGNNFPNATSIGNAPGQNTVSSFPAAAGSAIGFLLDSADGTKSLDIVLSALETEGRARIISRPSVAMTNNREAIIKSVEKIRIKTPDGGLSVATGQGAAASSSSAVATEVVEVGIVLNVTAQASPDYFVLLDVNAKSSTFGTQPVDGIPSEIERSATSTVLVSSGQTFVMGGIYKISDTDSVEGVPFLKDVPFFGSLFRRSLTNNSDEELLFFLTPRIIEGSFDDAAMKANN